MGRQKTTEEFKQDVFKLVGDEYSVISEYTKAIEPITMQHNCEKCNNHIFTVRPNDFLANGIRCHMCNKRVKKDTFYFIGEVKELVGDEYTVGGKYTKSNVKVKFIHNNEECNNYEFDMTPNSFLRGQRCPKCGGTKKKTHSEFLEEFNDKFGNEYTVLSEYINGITKIKIIHNCDKCNNYIFEATPNSLLRGSGCPKCAGNTLKSNEQFIEEIYNLVGNEYTVISNYKNTKTKIEFIHNNNSCNYHTFSMTPNSFLRGQRCPKCNGNIKLTHDEFVERVKYLTNNEYSVIGKYIDSSTKVKMKHNICGHIYDVKPNKFTSGRRCPNCNGGTKKTHEKFILEVNDKVGNEYSVLGKYINSKTKVLMKHNECSHEWEVNPTAFLCGSRCPKCVESKGEKGISEWLCKNSIINESQYKFDDCKNTRRLPFDFAIFNKNKELILLIEYDGMQHFEPVNFGGMTEDEMLENFKTTQHHDQIKNTYCITNNIPLLRIPYWEFKNIEEILHNELLKFNIIS